jgi:hypothetical protein
MAVPEFLSLTPYVRTLSGITDVETGGVGFISSFRGAAVTDGDWTEPSADLFKSPVDANGYFMDVLLTRISSTSLEIRLRDHLGRTIYTRRIHISGTVDGKVIASEKHFSILNTTGNEEAHGAMMDFLPIPHNTNDNHVWGAGRRNSSGTDDNGWNQSAQATSFFRDDTTIQARARFAGNVGGVNGVSHSPHLYVGEIPAVTPVGISGWNASSAIRGNGRPYGFVLVSAATFSVGSEPSLPVDESTQKTFRILYPNIVHVTPEMRIASLMS